MFGTSNSERGYGAYRRDLNLCGNEMRNITKCPPAARGHMVWHVMKNKNRVVKYQIMFFFIAIQAIIGQNCNYKENPPSK